MWELSVGRGREATYTNPSVRISYNGNWRRTRKGTGRNNRSVLKLPTQRLRSYSSNLPLPSSSSLFPRRLFGVPNTWWRTPVGRNGTEVRRHEDLALFTDSLKTSPLRTPFLPRERDVHVNCSESVSPGEGRRRSSSEVSDPATVGQIINSY